MLIQQGKVCPYCLTETVYGESSVIYGRDYGMIYLCKPCDAWVGVHEGTDKAKGRLANAELRAWKINAHSRFDRLWKSYLSTGVAKHKIRNGAYHWLAKQIGIERKEVHIGMFDIDQCKKAVLLCDSLFDSGDPIEFPEKSDLFIKLDPEKKL